MKITIIGLGSMGKRRIRCLHTLSCSDIVGVDARADRCAEAEKLYGIRTFATFEEAETFRRPDALVISVPPDVHHLFMNKAAAARLPFFVEASVVDTGLLAIAAECRRSGVLAAPSATMLYHPGIQLIARLVKEGALGKISNIVYHSGQYLPDWHNYEHVRDYYVSNPATGGAREIVPFELTWLTSVFGFPKRVSGHYRKTITIEGAERIEDTYNCLFDYGDFLMALTVDVVSRHGTRRLLINGDKKQLVWDWDEKVVRVFDPSKGDWEVLAYDQGTAATGYNANIGEVMYVEEFRHFLDAVQGLRAYGNTLENDHANLRLLYSVEQADRTGTQVPFVR